MKKFTTLIMATSITAVTMLASGNAFATGSKPGMHNAKHQQQSVKKNKQQRHNKQSQKQSNKHSHNMHNGHGGKPQRVNKRHGKNQKDVPAPIPGLLALAAAAGGGAMLRRKAKKGQATK